LEAGWDVPEGKSTYRIFQSHLFMHYNNNAPSAFSDVMQTADESFRLQSWREKIVKKWPWRRVT
jgi:hypothetical protein